MYTNRWVWKNKSTILPVSQYIDEFIIAGPLPIQCYCFKTRMSWHTTENDKSIPVFRNRQQAGIYAEHIEPDKALFLEKQPLDKLLTMRDLPAMVFVLDFDPASKGELNCTFIKLSNVEFPHNFTTPNLY